MTTKDETVATITEEELEIKIDLNDIGEGINGDYDPEDLDDEPLLRITCYTRNGDDEWEQIPNGSACTQINANTTPEFLDRFLKFAMRRIAATVRRGLSIKHIIEDLSWVSAGSTTLLHLLHAEEIDNQVFIDSMAGTIVVTYNHDGTFALSGYSLTPNNLTSQDAPAIEFTFDQSVLFIKEEK